MKIIVVGGGKVGRTLVEQLIEEGHDIAVIDSKSRVITNVTDNFDVMGVQGNGASYTVQQDAGIEDADLMIAVTDADEVNLLCCLVAKKAGGCNTIARVRNPIYNSEVSFIKEELGLSMTVNPEHAAATEAARILRFPSAISIDTFAKGHTEILRFKILENSILNDCRMMDISHKTGSEVLVATVERGQEVIIPNGQFILKAGDTISIVASPANAKRLFENMKMKRGRVRNCMIVGGGTVGYYLATQLLSQGIAVTIIEKSRERCEELSELIPDANIINGDATDQNVLIEEGIRECESFVSLTGIDEENIFLSLFARTVSDAKIITKINRINYTEVVDSLDLGSIIHPKRITAEYILRYVRAMENSIGSDMESLYELIEGRVEALEFRVRASCEVTDKPLSQIRLKKNVLIASITRNGNTIIPNGNSVIREGDSVVVVTSQKGFQTIEDIIDTGRG